MRIFCPLNLEECEKVRKHTASWLWHWFLELNRNKTYLGFCQESLEGKYRTKVPAEFQKDVTVSVFHPWIERMSKVQEFTQHSRNTSLSSSCYASLTHCSAAPEQWKWRLSKNEISLTLQSYCSRFDLFWAHCKNWSSQYPPAIGIP